MLVLVALLACSFPFAFRAYSIADLRHRGRTQAEEDWNAGRAEMHVACLDRGRDVTHRFDPATGLKIRVYGYMSKYPYSLAYQARVAALLAEHGIPEWSMKKCIPADDDLVAMLDSTQMEKINTFPHDVNHNIILIRHGTVTRWNTTFSNMSGFLAVATPQGLIDIGTNGGSSSSDDHSHVTLSCFGEANTGRSPNEPVFVGRSPKYPWLIFVRSGNDWVESFTRVGNCCCGPIGVDRRLGRALWNADG